MDAAFNDPSHENHGAIMHEAPDKTQRFIASPEGTTLEKGTVVITNSGSSRRSGHKGWTIRRNPDIRMSHLAATKIIGSGKYGTVYLVSKKSKIKRGLDATRSRSSVADDDRSLQVFQSYPSASSIANNPSPRMNQNEASIGTNATTSIVSCSHQRSLTRTQTTTATRAVHSSNGDDGVFNGEEAAGGQLSPRDNTTSLPLPSNISDFSDGGSVSTTEPQFYALKRMSRTLGSPKGDGGDSQRRTDRSSTSAYNRMVTRERDAMAKLSHPFHTQLINTYRSPSSLYILMEYVPGGDLSSRVHRKFGVSSEEEMKFYTINLVIAIKHMHLNGVIHRDIKPANILVASNGYLKLTDYGFSRELRIGEKTASIAGSYGYLAPEQCTNSPYDHSCDLWSLGVTCYYMMYGYLPFEPDFRTESAKQFRALTKHNTLFTQPRFISEANRSLPFQGKRFVRSLLRKTPEKRLGAQGNYDDLTSHEWFKDYSLESFEAMELVAPIPSPVVEDGSSNLSTIPREHEHHGSFMGEL